MNIFWRSFVIILKRDLNLVSDKVDIEVRYSFSETPSYVEHVNNYFTTNNYIGFVEGEPKSHVTCYLDRIDAKNVANLTREEYPLIYCQIKLENTNEYFYIEPIRHNEDSNKLKYLIYQPEEIESNVISNGLFKWFIFILINSF